MDLLASIVVRGEVLKTKKFSGPQYHYITTYIQKKYNLASVIGFYVQWKKYCTV